MPYILNFHNNEWDSWSSEIKGSNTSRKFSIVYLCVANVLHNDSDILHKLSNHGHIGHVSHCTHPLLLFSGVHHHMTLLTLYEEGISEADRHLPHEGGHRLTLLQGVNCYSPICLHCHIWPVEVSQRCHRCQVACISKVASMVEDLNIMEEMLIYPHNFYHK